MLTGYFWMTLFDLMLYAFRDAGSGEGLFLDSLDSILLSLRLSVFFTLVAGLGLFDYVLDA